MKNKLIILVSGYAKSGKDVFSNFLVDNNNFLNFKISSKLKNDVSKKYNIPLKKLETQEGKEEVYTINGVAKTGRQLLIETSAKERSKNNKVYINDVIHRIKCVDNNIVISDIRYPEEIESIKNVFKERKIIHTRIFRFDHPTIDDRSEKQLENYPYDYKLDNTGDIKSFISNISLFVKNFLC